MSDDKIQREIEDILSRLDDFVPEESVASRMRRRSSDAAGSFLRTVLAPIAAISLQQVMIAALVLIVVGFIGMRVSPMIGRWALIGGVILFLTTIALSLFNRPVSTGPKIEKRWRGQPMELDEPSFGDRLRAWFQSKKRPRY